MNSSHVYEVKGPPGTGSPHANLQLKGFAAPASVVAESCSRSEPAASWPPSVAVEPSVLLSEGYPLSAVVAASSFESMAAESACESLSDVLPDSAVTDAS